MQRPNLQPRHRCETATSNSGVYLIADEDEFFRVALKSILAETLGCAEVIETAFLEEAVEHLSSAENISMALFDLAIVEGAANMRAIRECFPDTKVAVVSAAGRRNDILLALKAGAHGYIPKDLGVAELTTAIEMIRSGAVYVPPSIANLGDAEDEAKAPTEHPVALPASATKGRLSRRQRQVLELIVEGRSNREIGHALGLAKSTIKVHVAALFRVLGVTNRTSIAVTGQHLSTPA